MTVLDAQRANSSAHGSISRRRLIGASAVAAIALAATLRPQLRALADAAFSFDGYGPLGPADDAGVAVPAGFEATVLARSGEVVQPHGFVWPDDPDGGACFPTTGGGHVYVANSEVADGGGGVSMLDFDAAGDLVDARSILSGTSMNCSGGATPWGTWLSCEEIHPTGLVWECHLDGSPAVALPALGRFRHEAVVVDPVRRQLFLTEDRPAGRLYRFRPARWPDLSAGVLSAATVTDGRVRWSDVDPTVPDRSPDTTPFDGGEGIVLSGSSLLFATKGDRRVWEFDLDTDRLSVFHDCIERPGTPLTHVDGLALHPTTGALFVGEDGGDMDLCMLVPGATESAVTSVVRFEGHTGSEVTGAAFSPDGRFLYLSSQRGTDGAGLTIRVAGPWEPWIRSIVAGADAGSGAVRLGNERRAGRSD